MNTLRGSLKLIAIFLVIIIAAPFQIICRFFKLKPASIIPTIVHRIARYILDIRIHTVGDAPGSTPTLIISNHVSWLDIVVISSLQPLSFIAKSEIANWPIFGFLAKMQNSIFIDRQRKRATAETNSEIADRLSNGDAIVLFAEGTTGDGVRLLPFRSSLIGAAHAAMLDDTKKQTAPRVQIKPLAISYQKRNGLPLTRRDRPKIAWYGDMDLAPHLWAFLCEGSLDVTVFWGDAIPLGSDFDRKAITSDVERTIQQVLGA
ncbi:1-acyl-sn-glycerol-3-phosphate acyltransferase [Microvirga sp. W0021]|uniref:1-acyl-sn-glycerol-3-phosphate acyltransferase n=1 Tax=Hohaiivirga grylli TaxID=3133970 RepID=A0ABV0BJM9_9HYPH